MSHQGREAKAGTCTRSQVRQSRATEGPESRDETQTKERQVERRNRPERWKHRGLMAREPWGMRRGRRGSGDAAPSMSRDRRKALPSPTKLDGRWIYHEDEERMTDPTGNPTWVRADTCW